MTNEAGIASCLDAKTGKSKWRKRIGGNFSASLLLAAGTIYFFDEAGKCTVIAGAPEYKELAVNQLDDGCMASPAVDGTALIVRTKTHVYRIE